MVLLNNFGDVVTAHSMKGDFNELWQSMVNIEAKHADHTTPWRDAEIELVTKKAHDLLGNLPTTKYNKDHLTKAKRILRQIEDGDDDFYRLNNLRDEIHMIWYCGSPDATQIGQYETFDKNNPDTRESWETDKYDKWTKLEQFTPESCPSRGDRNIKQKADIGFVQREHFFYHFIHIAGGSSLASRFHTFLHDIYEDRRSARMPLDHVDDAFEALEKGLITKEWCLGFIKRETQRASNELISGPSTWGKDDHNDYFTEWALIHDLIKKRPQELDCRTTNCHETRKPTANEMIQLRLGNGIKGWWCKKHIDKKTKWI